MAQVVVSQQFANPQSDLSFCPILKELFANLFVLSGAKLDDTLNQRLSFFFFTPVMTFLDIEIFEVKRAIIETDVVLAQSLSHLYDVFHFAIIKNVV
jgi:hypothetical protein